ncbi:MAG TPA: hypothetical protein VLI94_09580 [Solirubrobacterales bacterium]|nr:hypothetical protein [Solirubrobacterales bacterium]
MERWLERHGPALAVFIALVCAGYFAASTHVPDPVPGFALRSPGIYRLEIGVAFFVASFLAAMVLLRTLRDGPKGLRADAPDPYMPVDLDQIEDPASASSKRR